MRYRAVDDMSHRLSELQTRHSELKSEYSGVSQRAKVIEELEKRQEGVSSGAQELLRAARSQSSSAARSVIGMVADLIEVNVEHASLIDAALGDRAQYIVVSGPELSRELASNKLVVSGRVGVLDIELTSSSPSRMESELTDLPGVIGTIESLVQCNSEHRPLVTRLFAGSWLVQDLATALELRKQFSSVLRWVTLAGEIVEADGTLVVGPKASTQGIVSRRSELRSLVGQIESLRNEISGIEQNVSVLKKELRTGESQVQSLLKDNRQIAQELATLQAREVSLNEELKQKKAQRKTVDSELISVNSSVSELDASVVSLTKQVQVNESRQNQFKSQLTTHREKIDLLKVERLELSKQETNARVHLAKSEQAKSELRAAFGDIPNSGKRKSSGRGKGWRGAQGDRGWNH
ncbi:MAG: hypothetical protein R3C03_01940 [Pirellulaceae bacterium]